LISLVTSTDVKLHEEDIMTEFASTLPIPQERVLLQELNHRISNEFFSAMSLVSLAAARSSSDEVKVALSGVTELLHHYAEVHQALQIPQDDARIDAATYLSKLCLSLRRSKLDHMKINLSLAAPSLVLHSDECWLLGMIVYELVTNAARHAFAGRDGEIRVELLRAGAFVRCKVLDNGAAPAHVQRGRGLKIVGELINALDGRFEQTFGTAGSMSILVFPYSEGSARPQEQLPAKSGSLLKTRRRSG
jgi:two-component sensor histidine kinase